MLKLLQLLIFGHVHKWKILEQNNLVHRRHPSDGGTVSAEGERYVLQCETCGTLQQKDVI